MNDQQAQQKLNSIFRTLLDQQFQTQLFGDLDLKKRSNEYIGRCPNDPQHFLPSLSVKKREPFWYCHHCETGGNWIQFLIQYNNYSPSKAIHMLANTAGKKVLPAELPEMTEYIRQLALLETAHTYFKRQLLTVRGKDAFAYLQGFGYAQSSIKGMDVGYYTTPADLESHLSCRDFTQDEIHASGLTHDSLGGSFQLTIPYRNASGLLRGFVFRRLGIETPVYKFTTEVPVQKIFNKHRVIREQPLIVVERYLDALMANERGIPNVVATGGVPLNYRQVRELAASTDREIVFALDDDAAGQNTLREIISTLHHPDEFNLKVALVSQELQNHDGFLALGAYTKFRYHVSMACRLTEWYTKQLLDLTGMESERGQLLAKTKIMQFVSSMQRISTVERCLRAFSRNSQFDYKSLREEYEDRFTQTEPHPKPDFYPEALYLPIAISG